MPQKWTLAEMPRLDDKVAVVTGANRGLGLEICVGLAGAGATVVMACRDPRRAETALQEIRRRAPAARLEVMSLDLADLASVRRFAQESNARFARAWISCAITAAPFWCRCRRPATASKCTSAPIIWVISR